MDTGEDWVEIWMSVKKTIMSKSLRHDISKLEKEGWFIGKKKKRSFLPNLLHTFSKIMNRYNFCLVNIRIIKLPKKKKKKER